MVMVTGRFQIDPAQREAFLEFARGLVAGERTDPGCLEFEILETVDVANSFMMFEQWIDEDALEDHTASAAFEENDARLNSFILGEPSWDEYQF